MKQTKKADYEIKYAWEDGWELNEIECPNGLLNSKRYVASILDGVSREEAMLYMINMGKESCDEARFGVYVECVEELDENGDEIWLDKGCYFLSVWRDPDGSWILSQHFVDEKVNHSLESETIHPSKESVYEHLIYLAMRSKYNTSIDFNNGKRRRFENKIQYTPNQIQEQPSAEKNHKEQTKHNALYLFEVAT